MSLEELNSFLKKLKVGVKWFDCQKACVEFLEKKGYPTAKKEREKFEERVSAFLETEEHFYHVLDCSTADGVPCFTENEREIIISHYILGESLKKISNQKFLDKSTICRLLSGLKEKIITYW